MATDTLAKTVRLENLLRCAFSAENRPQIQFLVFPTGKGPYHWQVRALATDRVLSRHKLLAPALRRAGWLNRHRGTVVLGRCEFETPESNWGKCDGGLRCGDPGTVHHLESERDLCVAHFLQAELQ
jgi:hypothetical protein